MYKFPFELPLSSTCESIMQLNIFGLQQRFVPNPQVESGRNVRYVDSHAINNVSMLEP